MLHGRYRDRELATIRLQGELAAARLDALQRQLQPHFLFNSLHSIASLARAGDTAGVVRLIAGFSDMLRHLLGTGERHLALRDELQLVERYLEIQRVRFADRLDVAIELAPEAAGARVPLLVVQPLVENATAWTGAAGRCVLRRLPGETMPAVVFVTAYDRYAPQAFEQHAIEYLLKPFTDERFADVVEHLRERLRERTFAALGARLPDLIAEGARGERRQLVVRDGSRTHVIPHDDIVWIEAEDYYAAIHAGGRRILARESLRTLARSLDPARFARIHRSAIVNTRWIKAMEPLASGDQRLLLEDGTSLRVSRTHRAALLKLLTARD